MKKFIDVDGFKLFLQQLVKRLLNIEKNANDQISVFYQMIGWAHKNAPFINELTANGLTGNSLVEAIAAVNISLAPNSSTVSEYGGAFERINWLKEKLGASDAEAGTDSAFARIKKLETTTITADDLATSTDMEYLFDLYVIHDVDTLQETEKISIVYTHYITEDEKPAYLS